jgi:hypothetical protein
MAHIRFLLLIVFLAAPMVARAEPKQCGAETCGTPTKTTKIDKFKAPSAKMKQQ